MSGEVRIEFVDGHADVWRPFDDQAQLREIVEAAAKRASRSAARSSSASPRWSRRSRRGPRESSGGSTPW
jgi:hypothetical protein